MQTQLQLNRLQLTEDYLALSGQYLFGGLLLGLVRIVFMIGLSSGLLGNPPATIWQDIHQGLEMLMYFYTSASLVIVVMSYFSRSTDQNQTFLPILVNCIGVWLILFFAERVDFVTSTQPQNFITWAGLARDGLIRGGVYALIAVGYTLVYGILFMINFAHGEVMMFGAYAGFLAIQVVMDGGNRSFEAGAASLSLWVIPVLLGLLFLPLETLVGGYNNRRQINFQSPVWLVTFGSLPLRFLVGLGIGYGALVGLGGYAPHIYLLVITGVGVLFVMLCGMLTSMFVAYILERVAYRPLRKAPRLAPLISAIGASIFLQQTALRIFGPNSKAYDKPELLSQPPTFPVSLGDLGTLQVSKVGVMIVIFSLIFMAVLFLIVQRTKMGKAMRAVAEDKSTAALMGINVDQVIVFTFLLGAALAGASGVMLGFWGADVNLRFGFTPGLKAFTAAVLGGIGSIPGAMLGGFFLGLVEALGPLMIGINYQWQDVIAFSLLVLVLIFRPTGILGGNQGVKKV